RVLRSALKAQFGYDVVDPSARARLVVALAGRGSELRAELMLYDAAGRARWADHVQARGDCAQILSAAALLGGVGIDPLMRPSASPVQPPPPEPSVERGPLPAPSGWPKLRIGVGASVAVGLAPAPSVGFSGQIGARWRLWSISAEVRGDLPAAGT